MYLVPCNRCGKEYDFDADRSMNPHGHLDEPDANAVGCRVRLLSPVSRYGEVVLDAGTVGTVVRVGGHHHTENGGGIDMEVAVEGRSFAGRVYLTSYDDYRVVELPTITIRNRQLEVID